jgi:hypothetical protein
MTDNIYIFKSRDDRIIDLIYKDISYFSSNLTENDLDMVLRRFDYGFCLLDESSFHVIGLAIIFIPTVNYYIDISLIRTMSNHKYTEDHILELLINKISKFALSQNIYIIKVNDYEDALIPFYENYGFEIKHNKNVKGKNYYMIILRL